MKVSRAWPSFEKLWLLFLLVILFLLLHFNVCQRDQAQVLLWLNYAHELGVISAIAHIGNDTHKNNDQRCYGALDVHETQKGDAENDADDLDDGVDWGDELGTIPCGLPGSEYKNGDVAHDEDDDFETRSELDDSIDGESDDSNANEKTAET